MSYRAPHASCDRWLTVNEVSQRLALSEKAVRAAIHREELPATKVCRRIRIAEQDLKEWIQHNRVTHLQQPSYESRPFRSEPVSTKLRSLLP